MTGKDYQQHQPPLPDLILEYGPKVRERLASPDVFEMPQICPGVLNDLAGAPKAMTNGEAAKHCLRVGITKARIQEARDADTPRPPPGSAEARILADGYRMMAGKRPHK